MASSSWPDGLSDYKFNPNPSQDARASKTAEYFGITGNGDYYCIACKDGHPSKKFIVKDGKTGITTRFGCHLKREHPVIYRQIFDDQGRICNFPILKREFTGITEERTLEMALNLVYRTDLNFNAVLDKGMIRWLSFCARRKVTLPCAEVLEDAAFKKYNAVKAFIRELLAPVRKVSITLDRCDTVTEIPIVGIRAHWVDDTWTLCERFLDVVEMASNLDGDDDKDDDLFPCLLIETLQDFNLMDKVYAITTNHAKNYDKMMVSFPEALKGIEASFDKQYHMACLAHVVNQIAQEGLQQLGILRPPTFGFDDESEDSDSPTRPFVAPTETSDYTLRPFIGRLRDAILATLASTRSKTRYKKLCQDLRMPDKKRLQLDIPKEWTSTYEMLAAAWKKRQVLDKMPIDAMYRAEEWESLKLLIRMLSPLHYCVELLRKSNLISASTAIRTVETLLSLMDSYIKELDVLSSGASNLAWSKEQLALLKDTYRVMQEKLSMFDNSLRSSPTFAIAAVLDPQMKLNGSLSTQRGLVYESIVQLLDGTMPEGDNNIDVGLDTLVQEELDEYFKEACIVHEDPLTWWRQTGYRRFPRLAVLAKNFLSICPVSTSFERMFEAGLKTVPYNTCEDSLTTLLMTLKCWAWEEDPESHMASDTEDELSDD